MVEVHEHVGLVAKDFPALEPDPLGSIGDDVDAAFQRPARVAGAVGHAPSGLCDGGEARRVTGLFPALGARRAQAHFLPLAGTHGVAWAPRRHGADHGPIGLRDDVGGAFPREQPEVLRVVPLQLPGGARRVPQRRAAHGRGAEFKPVVFLEPLAALAKGMPASKVAQRALEPPGLAARRDAGLRGEHPQVAVAGSPPDALLDGHQSEDTPPAQGFFL